MHPICGRQLSPTHFAFFIITTENSDKITLKLSVSRGITMRLMCPFSDQFQKRDAVFSISRILNKSQHKKDNRPSQ